MTEKRMTSWEPMTDSERAEALERFVTLTDVAIKEEIPRAFTGQRSVVVRTWCAAHGVGDRSVRNESITEHPLLQCIHTHFVAEHGTGKTRLVEVIARLFDVDYEVVEGNDQKRARHFLGQLTIYESGGNQQRLIELGSLLRNNIVLVDEGQRMLSDVQSAILGVMTQEAVPLTVPHVDVSGGSFDGVDPEELHGEAREEALRRGWFNSRDRYPLRNPFWIIYADNPLEYIGVNPMGPAANDRFGQELRMQTILPKDLIEINKMDRDLMRSRVHQIGSEEVWRFNRRFLFFESYVAPSILQYIAHLALAIAPPPMGELEVRRIQERIDREQAIDQDFLDLWRGLYQQEIVIRDPNSPDDYEVMTLREAVTWDTPTRANLFLQRLAIPMAAIQGELSVRPHHVRKIFHDVVRHRIFLSQSARQIIGNDFRATNDLVEQIASMILRNITIPRL